MKKKVLLFLAALLTITSACSSSSVPQTETDEETVSSSQSERPVCSDNQVNLVNSDEPFSFPGGGVWNYIYVKRYFSLSDVAKIRIRMTYKEVTDLLGEPNGYFGSGLIYPYYVTYDKACVLINAIPEPDAWLSQIIIVDQSGRWYKSLEEKKFSDDMEQPVSSDVSFAFPGGGFYTYENIERDITLADVAKINLGMTYKEITDLLGEPNGLLGTENADPYYVIYDNACIVLDVNPMAGLRVYGIFIVDSGGRWYEFDEKTAE